MPTYDHSYNWQCYTAIKAIAESYKTEQSNIGNELRGEIAQRDQRASFLLGNAVKKWHQEPRLTTNTLGNIDKYTNYDPKKDYHKIYEEIALLAEKSKIIAKALYTNEADLFNIPEDIKKQPTECPYKLWIDWNRAKFQLGSFERNSLTTNIPNAQQCQIGNDHTRTINLLRMGNPVVRRDRQWGNLTHQYKVGPAFEKYLDNLETNEVHVYFNLLSKTENWSDWSETNYSEALHRGLDKNNKCLVITIPADIDVLKKDDSHKHKPPRTVFKIRQKILESIIFDKNNFFMDYGHKKSYGLLNADVITKLLEETFKSFNLSVDNTSQDIDIDKDKDKDLEQALWTEFFYVQLPKHIFAKAQENKKIVKSCNFTCKDGVDRGRQATAIFASKNDTEAFNNIKDTLSGPAKMVHDRPINNNKHKLLNYLKKTDQAKQTNDAFDTGESKDNNNPITRNNTTKKTPCLAAPATNDDLVHLFKTSVIISNKLLDMNTTHATSHLIELVKSALGDNLILEESVALIETALKNPSIYNHIKTLSESASGGDGDQIIRAKVQLEMAVRYCNIKKGKSYYLLEHKPPIKKLENLLKPNLTLKDIHTLEKPGWCSQDMNRAIYDISNNPHMLFKCRRDHPEEDNSLRPKNRRAGA